MSPLKPNVAVADNVVGSPVPLHKYRPVTPSFAIAPRVAVIIPTRNEAENLPHVFATLPPWVDELIVVDGRSTDDTVAVARRLRPDVRVVHQVGTGKGNALVAGVRESTADIVVLIDADGSTDGAEIVHFVAALIAGAEFAKGSRFANGGGTEDMTYLRKLGNRCLSVLVNKLYGTRYTDLCYGYNAFWTEHLEALRLDCDGFEIETMMNIRAARAGLKIQEIPSFERSRIHGCSNLRTFRDGWRVLSTIIRERFRPAPQPMTAAPGHAPLREQADQGAA